MVQSNGPHPQWDQKTTDNLQGKLIYKDECVKCFGTPKDDAGLNVCLKTLQGFCGGKNCSDTNVAAGNTIYMNIKMVPKAEPKEEGGQEKKPQEITKLAIGKPGGIDAETDKYETIVSVIDKESGNEIDRTHPKVASLVDSVLLANSAQMTSAVSEWEQEIKPCPCVLNLDQSQAKPIESKSNSQCGHCDLKANLWLNLSTGFIGCGRRYYDGSGGNNHAIDYFKETGNGLCVKLGTITAEGTASIYCYKCDDDVHDPKLAEHMAVFGIDIAKAVKTESTMTELNLQANLNLTLSKVLEEGKKLTPVFGPGLTGLENLGNSCYMNSILQVFFSFSEFKAHFYTDAEKIVQECTRFAPDDYVCQTRKLAIGLFSGEYSQKKIAQKVVSEENKEVEQEDEFYQDGIRPQIFKSLIGKGSQDFSGGQQQDCREYLSWILDKMRQGEKKAGSGQNPEDSFGFEIEQRFQCTVCKKVRYNRQKEIYLYAPIPVDSNVPEGTEVPIEACLEAFFTDEIIEGIECPYCGQKHDQTLRKRFIDYPKTLIVIPKRMVFDNWVPKKLQVEITVDANAVHDYEKYVGNNAEHQPGEETFEEPDEIEPEFDQGLINTLTQNGVPEIAAKHALHNTGGSSAEAALEWFYMNIGNPAVEVPLKIPNPKKQAAAEPDEIEPEFDANLLQMCTMNGVPEIAAKHALHNTGGQSAEAAVEWFYMNIENPAIQVPLKVPNPKKQAAQPVKDKNEPDPEAVETLKMFGFTEKQAKRGLRKCDGNQERAADWIMNHMDDPDSEDEEAEAPKQPAAEVKSLFKDEEPNKGAYSLHGTITHLGASVHAGHYVCHVKKEGKWIYFNDSKVAETDDPPLGKGYMYFFRKAQK